MDVVIDMMNAIIYKVGAVTIIMDVVTGMINDII